MQLLKSLLQINSLKLFHLSLDSGLSGVWHPKLPLNESDLAEADIPRISCSPSELQAFQAIYPNISHLFEEENLPYIDLAVYSPVIEVKTKIIYPEDLTTRRLVWDAHVTSEHGILTSTQMNQIGVIRIFNTSDKPDLFTCPYNDNNEAAIFVAPAKMDFKYL